VPLKRRPLVHQQAPLAPHQATPDPLALAPWAYSVPLPQPQAWGFASAVSLSSQPSSQPPRRSSQPLRSSPRCRGLVSLPELQPLRVPSSPQGERRGTLRPARWEPGQAEEGREGGASYGVCPGLFRMHSPSPESRRSA